MWDFRKSHIFAESLCFPTPNGKWTPQKAPKMESFWRPKSAFETRNHTQKANFLESHIFASRPRIRLRAEGMKNQAKGLCTERFTPGGGGSQDLTIARISGSHDLTISGSRDLSISGDVSHAGGTSVTQGGRQSRAGDATHARGTSVTRGQRQSLTADVSHSRRTSVIRGRRQSRRGDIQSLTAD